jgi:hypothetical protein
VLLKESISLLNTCWLAYKASSPVFIGHTAQMLPYVVMHYPWYISVVGSARQAVIKQAIKPSKNMNFLTAQNASVNMPLTRLDKTCFCRVGRGRIKRHGFAQPDVSTLFIISKFVMICLMCSCKNISTFHEEFKHLISKNIVTEMRRYVASV